MLNILLYIILLICHFNYQLNATVKYCNTKNNNQKEFGVTFNNLENFFAIINDDWLRSKKDEINVYSTSTNKLQPKNFIKKQVQKEKYFNGKTNLYFSKSLLPFTIDLPPPLA